MFTLYLIDFLYALKIDPIQCEQCSGKSNWTGPDRYVIELFTPYQIDMLLFCFGNWQKKPSLESIKENDNEIPF